VDGFPLAFVFGGGALVDGAFVVAGFGEQFAVAGPAGGLEFACGQGVRDGAGWFAVVGTVVETALAGEGGDGVEDLFHRVFAGPEGEFAEAGSVDEGAAAGEVEEHAAGGGVAAS